MDRYQGFIALAICLAVATASAKQPDGRITLAKRLSALRTGWGTTADQPVEASPQDLVEQETSTTTFSDQGQLPRINPRNLLPKSWNTADPIAAQATDHPNDLGAEEVPSQEMGTARGRMLRDARNERGLTTEQRPPVPRAGSVLSPISSSEQGLLDASTVQPTDSTNPETIALTPSNSKATPDPWATSALTRSIASEVAQSLAITDEADRTEATETYEGDSIDSELADSNEMIEAVEPVELVEPMPTPLPVIAESVPTETVTAEEVPIARLPLSIGEQTVPTNQPSTLDTHTAYPTNQNVSAKVQPSVVDRDELLTSQSMPLIGYQVAGPRQIVVGREATYRVTLSNHGDTPADQLDARVTVPDWAEVVGVEATSGRINQHDMADHPGELLWQIDHLAGKDTTQLDLKLIARAGRPIEIGVKWKHSPVSSQTMVEVQEPKLSMSLNGPNEVLYGRPQTFRLTVSNPGTGTAEAVTLQLTPPGGDTTRRVRHEFGLLTAGESRTVEIELTAREAGMLSIDAAATADGNISADVSKEVLCRKAELAVDWRGPKERYSGAPATYFLRVRNPGTATAPDVLLTADLPEGFEPIATDKGGHIAGGVATFQVGSLRAGDDRYFELKGILTSAGSNTIDLQAKASDETLSERITVQTKVIALADLKLDVLDPKGPVATGQEVEYQIRVTNRGSNEAHEVRILGLFSEGIEPVHVTGGQSTIVDGRVAIETIETIPAGAERVFTIHARAHEAGTHLFRAEVLCRDLEIKLAAEETTRFFEDESMDVANQSGSRYGY